ncbi:MAG: hypothetical protein ABIS46_02950, partial [Sphingomicrobium sp.]
MNKMPTNEMSPPELIEDAKAKAAAVRKAKRAASKRRRNLAIMLVVPLLIIGVGAYHWLTSGVSVSTDDARIKQNIVAVSPLVSGPVAKAYV